jgi:hypothetical protein
LISTLNHVYGRPCSTDDLEVVHLELIIPEKSKSKETSCNKDWLRGGIFRVNLKFAKKKSRNNFTVILETKP